MWNPVCALFPIPTETGDSKRKEKSGPLGFGLAPRTGRFAFDSDGVMSVQLIPPSIVASNLPSPSIHPWLLVTKVSAVTLEIAGTAPVLRLLSLPPDPTCLRVRLVRLDIKALLGQNLPE